MGIMGGIMAGLFNEVGKWRGAINQGLAGKIEKRIAPLDGDVSYFNFVGNGICRGKDAEGRLVIDYFYNAVALDTKKIEGSTTLLNMAAQLPPVNRVSHHWELKKIDDNGVRFLLSMPSGMNDKNIEFLQENSIENAISTIQGAVKNMIPPPLKKLPPVGDAREEKLSEEVTKFINNSTLPKGVSKNFLVKLVNDIADVHGLEGVECNVTSVGITTKMTRGAAKIIYDKEQLQNVGKQLMRV